MYSVHNKKTNTTLGAQFAFNERTVKTFKMNFFLYILLCVCNEIN